MAQLRVEFDGIQNGHWRLVNVDKCIQVREPLVSSYGPKNCVLCLKIGDTCTVLQKGLEKNQSICHWDWLNHWTTTLQPLKNIWFCCYSMLFFYLKTDKLIRDKTEMIDMLSSRVKPVEGILWPSPAGSIAKGPGFLHLSDYSNLDFSNLVYS